MRERRREVSPREGKREREVTKSKEETRKEGRERTTSPAWTLRAERIVVARRNRRENMASTE